MAKAHPAVQHPFISVGTRGFDPSKVVLWWSGEETLTLVFDSPTLYETYTGTDRLLLLAWLAEHSVELH